jgi:hypothetical protein
LALAQEVGRWQFLSATFDSALPGEPPQKDQALLRIDTRTGEVAICSLDPYTDKLASPPVGYRLTCVPVQVARP